MVITHASCLVSVSRRVILRTNHQTASLLRTAIDGLDDIDEFLLVFARGSLAKSSSLEREDERRWHLQDPVQLVIVTRPEITCRIRSAYAQS